MKTTANEFCIPGRFWSTVPARERTEEELETLRALVEMENEEIAEMEEALK